MRLTMVDGPSAPLRKSEAASLDEIEHQIVFHLASENHQKMRFFDPSVTPAVSLKSITALAQVFQTNKHRTQCPFQGF